MEQTVSPEPSLFDGSLDTREALQRLRARLLDLSARNRLLNFPKKSATALPFVNTPLEALFNRLMEDEKAAEILPVPEPEPEEMEEQDGALRKPDARAHAQRLGIDVSFDISVQPTPQSRLQGVFPIQTLLYPHELERTLRKIDQAARTALEESGTNMLHLVFGFLEWKESPQADRALLAPLITVPVSLKRGAVDRKTGYYRYQLAYSGEDISGNFTLAEKLRQEMGLVLPEWSEEDSPSKYFARIEEFIKYRPGWRLRPQSNLCLLYFGKLLMYLDLDPKKWPADAEIYKHPLVKGLFQGMDRSTAASLAEEYSIDEHPTATRIPLVYDADSSQHSALVDAIEGKSLVIEGPPGTGKSQTITNLISAAIAKGKTVLFVSEKLAALEVVRRRLDQAGLGAFCLELHSHKTQKKRLLEDLGFRLKQSFPDTRQLDAKLQELENRRSQLKDYAERINQPSGSALRLTVNQVLWASERHRQPLGDLVDMLGAFQIERAFEIGPADLSDRLDVLNQLAQYHSTLGDLGSDHPWYGYVPLRMVSGDEQQVFQALETLSQQVGALQAVHTEAQTQLQIKLPDTEPALDSLVSSFHEVKLPLAKAAYELLPALQRSGVEQAIASLVMRIQQVRELRESLSRTFRQYESLDDAQLARLRHAVDIAEQWSLGSAPLNQLRQTSEVLIGLSTELESTLTLLARVAEQLGVATPTTLEATNLLSLELQVAQKAPLDLLLLRHARWLEVAVREKISAAREQAAHLLEQRNVLGQQFSLSAVPERKSLTTAMLALRAGGMFRFFRSDWRAARRLVQGLSKDPKAKISDAEAASRLEDLIGFLEQKELFEKKQDFVRSLGEEFIGLDTDFDKLERIATWYAEVQDLLLSLPASMRPRPEALIDQPSDRLRECARLVRSAAPACDTLATLDQRLARCIPLSVRPESLRLQNQSDLRGAVVSLRKAGETLNMLENLLVEAFREPVNPRKARDSVKWLETYRQARATLEQLEGLREILGSVFQGEDTDVAALRRALEWTALVKTSALPADFKGRLLEPEAPAHWTQIQRWLDRAMTSWRAIQSAYRTLEQFGQVEWLDWYGVAPATVGVIRTKAERTLAARGQFLAWVDYTRVLHRCQKLRLGALVNLVRAEQLPAAALPTAFLYVFYHSLARQILHDNPTLLQFSGLNQSQIRQRYADLDREVIKLTGQRLACQSASRPVPLGQSGGLVKALTEKALIEHELTKQKRHIPIRRLVERAGAALQALKPCFMMGPMSVSQYLPPGKLKFDLVVMDEASQMRPEDAIATIARGGQVVVVGDPKQLPPSNFFNRMSGSQEEDEEEETAQVESAESILDICQFTFRPSRRLRWHYRSEHERLIAFSNKYFYEGELVVFPSPHPAGAKLGVRYHYLPDAIYENRCNRKEAERVAEAVIRHLLTSPDESLGVVTMNNVQCELVEEELERRLKLAPSKVQEYLDHWDERGEPLFVKNLENVQGDERHVIFISCTYGKGPQGVVRNSFGPINQQVGWRRLNVLFTRAKRRVELFTSMEADDIRVDARSSRGLQALKAYLTYAREGHLGAPVFSEREPDSDFEIAVATVLCNAGYQVVPQLGVAGFFIDIAVRNPDRPGQFLAAVECDGATYHSARSVRDRDRLRQQVLERLGWEGRIFRIWSTDWFRDPRSQSQRLLNFLKDLRAKQPPGDSLVPETQEHGAPVQLMPSAIHQVRDSVVLPKVEVGSRVTYMDTSDPDREMVVRIVSNQSTPKSGVIGEQSPLAQTLLSAHEGDEVELNVSGVKTRILKVVRIEQGL